MPEFNEYNPEVEQIMNSVIEYKRRQSQLSERFWEDTKLDQPDFFHIFTQLAKSDNLKFKNVIYNLCEENRYNDINDIAALCRKAQYAYSLDIKNRMLLKELVSRLPGATIKSYHDLDSHFPTNSVCITEMQYDNKTFYIWTYRYRRHWDEDDAHGKSQRKYCVLKNYFYKLLLNNMDKIPDGYHIFCPYTTTATDRKNTINDIIIWDTFKELRIKRIVDLIENKLQYAKWDSTIKKMNHKASELDLFLSEAVSYINKGHWAQYVDELKNSGGFPYPPNIEPEMKKYARCAVQDISLFDDSVTFSDETVLIDGNLCLVSGIVESLNDAGEKISQKYSVEIKNRIIIDIKIGDWSSGEYVPLNRN